MGNQAILGSVGGRILIIGAGPAGLGAAYTLQRMGHDNFQVVEQNEYPGGLGASFLDPNGFVWDLGAHIHFRQHAEYVGLLDECCGNQSAGPAMRARIWTHGRLIPHPFQLNLRLLPAAVSEKCLRGLLAAEKSQGAGNAPSNLEDWIGRVYGSAIAEEFLVPYCRKAWSHDPSEMSADWAGKRFPQGDTAKCIASALAEDSDDAAGRRSAFTYPTAGGNGVLWRWLAGRLRSRITYGRAVSRLDSKARAVIFSDGCAEHYDKLISTMPLDQLIGCSDLAGFQPIARELKYTTMVVIGLGLRGAIPAMLRDTGWVYCAEPKTPFYRLTVQSNLARDNVPNPDKQWSVMLETSHKPGCVTSVASLIQRSLTALSNWGLPIREEDVEDTWAHTVERAYPVPVTGSNRAVCAILKGLRDLGIHSCGRFGAWRYEAANQDDCFLEGGAIAASLWNSGLDELRS
jgi:protoporphyrinogen oxidase